MHYLVIVSVPFYRLDDRRAATDGTFAIHLKALLASLRPTVTSLEVLAPSMTQAVYSATRTSMHDLDADADNVSFTAAFPSGLGIRDYLLNLPRIVIRMWHAIGRAGWVHAGPSHLFFPFENLGLLFGWLRRRKTIYVADIDHRNSARMNLATGKWSWGVYWRRRLVHDRWASLQHHLARMLCSTLFLKGTAMARDYGRGKDHVHHILDCAHSADMILDATRLERKLARLAVSNRLRTCYFGRLVEYKGIDCMLRAVSNARQTGVDATFDVFGSGDCLDALVRLTRDLNLDGVVQFHGSRPYGPTFFAELEEYDLLLAAPLSEDTPRSAIDAQALGISVLAFDTYYYAELAGQGAAVLLVPWLNTTAMAKAIVELCNDRTRLCALSRRAIAFASANTQEEWLRRRAGWTLGSG